MKIDLAQIDRENFLVQERMFNGETVFLVNPNHIGAKYTRETLKFRSSLWNSDGELISASFPKFYNWLEQPELSPVPTTLKGHRLIEKVDGSTLIVSKYKGGLIIRTRGTVDARALENGHEIDGLIEAYPKAFNNYHLDSRNVSLIFEWTTPSNKIVLDYGDKPQIWLIGLIWHSDYSLESQESLDKIAFDLGVGRPRVFNFGSVAEMLDAVEKLQDQEGLCVYSPNGQVIKKVKSARYLCYHRFKSNANIETVLDLFVEYGYPPYTEFEDRLVTEFDYECFNMVRGFASQVSDAWEQVAEIKAGMGRFVGPLIGLPRKEAAQKIIAAYGTTNRASFCFQILDKKTLDHDANKKLMWQCLKK